METVELVITPEMAQEYLKKNKKNRTLSNSKVSLYARDMKAGRWDLTHQGLAFDTEGNLIDGQHRLYACIKAGVPFKTQVSFGSAVSANIDCGRNRTLRDRMYTSGKAEKGVIYRENAILSAVRYGITWPSRNNCTSVSPDVIEEALDLYQEEWNKTYSIFLVRNQNFRGSTGAPTTLALFWAICNGVNPDLVKEWYRVLGSGEYDTPKMRSVAAAKSILIVRNYFIKSGRSANSGEVNSLETFKKCLASIKYYDDGYVPTKIYGSVCFDNPYEGFTGEKNDG